MAREDRVVAATTTAPLEQRAEDGSGGGWRSGLLVLVMLYLFITGINMMGGGLKVAAEDPAAKRSIDGVFSFAGNPFVGLCVGLLVTSIVQSSSFTTSLVVSLTVSGQLSLASAVPIVLGANVGTSITAVLVSLGHIRRRREFRLALSGAATHSFFKISAVIVLFPLELAFGVLSKPATVVGKWLGGTGAFTTDPGEFNFIKMAVSPLTDACKWLFLDGLDLSLPIAGGLVAATALALLFFSLFYLVVGLKGLLMHRIGGLFQRVLFARPWTGFIIGILATALVQSSSVTTSLAVPLLAVGVLKLRQIYPYILGADIGTTVTAILASLASAATAADPEKAWLGLAVAAAHLLFNLAGVAVFWPLQRIPMAMGKEFAKVASRRRGWVIAGVLGMFFVIPVLVIVGASLFR